MEHDLLELVSIFQHRIKGAKLPVLSHDGSIGHWIEKQFGISANADNAADWNGYELKSGSSKTTFGDWSADYYLWNTSSDFSRTEFLKIFGTKSRLDRPNRYSWSGTVFPKSSCTNSYGQCIVADIEKGISIYYDFSKDNRKNKHDIVPAEFQDHVIELAHWSKEGLQRRIRDKFGQKGWVKFVKQNGTFDQMWIGGPIHYDDWINSVKNGDIFLDSGMYYDPDKPNNRPYSNWRASNSFWLSMAKHIID